VDCLRDTGRSLSFVDTDLLLLRVLVEDPLFVARDEVLEEGMLLVASKKVGEDADPVFSVLV